MSEANGVKPKGLLEPPDEIVHLVDNFPGVGPPTPEERQREINNFTLSYFYGGEIVVCKMDENRRRSLGFGGRSRSLSAKYSVGDT